MDLNWDLSSHIVAYVGWFETCLVEAEDHLDHRPVQSVADAKQRTALQNEMRAFVGAYLSRSLTGFRTAFAGDTVPEAQPLLNGLRECFLGYPTGEFKRFEANPMAGTLNLFNFNGGRGSYDEEMTIALLERLQRQPMCISVWPEAAVESVRVVLGRVPSALWTEARPNSGSADAAKHARVFYDAHVWTSEGFIRCPTAEFHGCGTLLRHRHTDLCVLVIAVHLSIRKGADYSTRERELRGALQDTKAQADRSDLVLLAGDFNVNEKKDVEWMRTLESEGFVYLGDGSTLTTAARKHAVPIRDYVFAKATPNGRFMFEGQGEYVAQKVQPGTTGIHHPTVASIGFELCVPLTAGVNSAPVDTTLSRFVPHDGLPKFTHFPPIPIPFSDALEERPKSLDL